MRFLFFGSPDYTEKYLDCLAELGSVVGVVTAPNRPCGRGQGIHCPRPAAWAEAHALPCFQPESLRDPELVRKIQLLKADLGVVVAYGRILPRAIFALPRLETINVHFSLLPSFRGASPIESALLCGSTETGVSVQRIVEALDAGDIIESYPVRIAAEDHFPELFDKLVAAGLEALSQAIAALKSGKAVFTPQAEPRTNQCGKILPEMRQIDWSCPATTVYNRIRAFAGHRTAWTYFRGNKFLIHRARLCPEEPLSPKAAGGQIVKVTRSELLLACGDGHNLSLLEVQPENRKRMSTADCINGIHPLPGERFG